MNTKPERHAFIFIKTSCDAKTLNHKYLGILYERWVQKTNSSCILQGLYGRLTGYHNNKTSVVFSVPIMNCHMFSNWLYGALLICCAKT